MSRRDSESEGEASSAKGLLAVLGAVVAKVEVEVAEAAPMADSPVAELMVEAVEEMQVETECHNRCNPYRMHTISVVLDHYNHRFRHTNTCHCKRRLPRAK